MSESVEAYLRPSPSDGKFVSEGEFTVKVDVARKKAAKFTLQQEGDWAVKVLQALLASGAQGDIKVQCLKDATLFLFQLGKPWDLDETRESVFGVVKSESRALKHLEAGLLPVTVTQKREVQIKAFGASSQLYWNGSKLDIGGAVEVSGAEMFIRVSHLSSEEKKSLGWVGAEKLKRERRLAVSTQIKRRIVFADNVISLDAIDLDYSEQILHDLRVRGLTPLLCWRTGGAFSKSWVRKIKDQLPSKIQGEDAFPKSGDNPQRYSVLTIQNQALQIIRDIYNTEYGQPQHHKSKIYWVCDGVVVGQDQLPVSAQVLGVQMYIKAEDLPLDLSGFSLRFSEERRALLQSAVEQVDLEFSELRPRFEDPDPKPEPNSSPSKRIQLTLEESKALLKGTLVGGLSAIVALKLGGLPLLGKALFKQGGEVVLFSAYSGGSIGLATANKAEQEDKKPEQPVEKSIFSKRLDKEFLNLQNAWRSALKTP